VVEDFATAEEAAQRAALVPPDAVVTDLWMPRMSGLQLCRLLRSEPATKRIPIILLTASEDKRTRFWANHAGASAFVNKADVSPLYARLAALETSTTTSQNAPVRTQQKTVPERLSELLDDLLQTSTLAGELRKLGHSADSSARVFEGLTQLLCSLMSYRWLALMLEDDTIFVQAHPACVDAALAEAQDCFGVREREPQRRKDEQAGVFRYEDAESCEEGLPSTEPHVLSIAHGSMALGQLALSAGRRGISRDERRLLTLIEHELGGPLRMAFLVSEATRLAATDSLTGLLNRRAFTEKFQEAQKRNAMPFSVLVLDVDHFKKINDSRGHDVGDVVLKRIASLLRSAARRRDIVGRWGGEEFVIALPGSPEVGARIAAERIRRTLADEPVETTLGEALLVTASIGVATAQSKSDSLEELIQRADKALYNAKARGRNRVETI
jgi:two-component system, cell cycle response regulator